MGKYFIFVLGLFTFLNLKSQVYWSENFETSTVDDWSVSNGTWEIGNPGSGPGSAFNGLNCAATVLDGNYSDGNYYSRITSPVILIPELTKNPRLRFQHWYSFSSSDYGKVQISSDGGSNWQDLSENFTVHGSNVWSQTYFDLGNYAGTSIQLCFYFNSGDGYGGDVSSGWYIDNVEIDTGAIVFNNPETWEEGLGDWYVEEGTWEIGNPGSGPGSAYGGLKCAATVLNGNYVDGTYETRLSSPYFTVPELSGNPRLRFQHWFSFSSSDHGKVQIRTVGTSAWQDLSENYTVHGSNVWSQTLLDLSDYAGSDVQLCFYFYSGDAYGGDVSSGWYIDNVEIDTGAIVFNNAETWECGLGDWYVEKGVWEVGNPSSGPENAYEDEQCVATVLKGNYSDGSYSSRVVSPYIQLNGNGVYNLTFQHWYSFSSSDEGYVQVKIKGNSNWVNISDAYTSTSGGVWSKPQLNLGDYAGEEIQVAFYFVSGDSYGNDISTGWYIDNISINGIYKYPDINPGENKSICTGDQVTLGGNPTLSNGYGDFKVVWEPSVSLNDSSLENPIATPVISTTYTVSLAGVDGCVRPEHVSVIVHPNPEAFAGEDKTICQGESEVIGANPTASGGTPSYSYSWLPATGLNNAGLSQPLATPQATTEYILTVNDANNCSDNDTIEISVHPWPVIFAGGDISLCAGDSVILGADPTVESGSEPFTYKWEPKGYLDNDTISNPICNPENNVTYELTVVDKYGCTKTDTTSVEVNLLPEVHPGIGREICQGELITLGASPAVSGGTGPYSYQWAPNNAVDVLTEANPQVQPNDTVVYSLLVVDSKSCTDTGRVKIDVIPVPEFTLQAPDTIIKGDYGIIKVKGDIETFDYLLKPMEDSVQVKDNYLWLYTSPEIATSYIFTATNIDNECSDYKETQIEVKEPVNIDRLVSGSHIMFYPNPVKNKLNVVYCISNEEDLYINIFSITGQKLISKKLTQNNSTIDISNLLSGSYVVEFIYNGKTEREIIVKK